MQSTLGYIVMDEAENDLYSSQNSSVCFHTFIDNNDIKFDNATGDTRQLGDSYQSWKRHLSSLERTVDSNSQLSSDYNATIQAYIDKGFLTNVSECTYHVIVIFYIAWSLGVYV